MMKKILSGLVCAAVVLSLAGCGSENPINSELTNALTSKINSTSAVNSANTGNVIPEIPVTEADAFKYEYNADMHGMVITDYLKESPKVRIPDTLEGEPVVGVDLSDCEKQLTQLVLPSSVCGMSLSDTIEKNLLYLVMPTIEYKNAYKYDPDYSGQMTEEDFYKSQIEGGHYSFSGCEKLLAVEFGEKCSRFETLDGMIYYDYNGRKILLVCPQGKSGAITVPSGTTEIGSHAFYRCGKITSIYIPDSVTKIDKCAFKDCGNLTSVTIPDSVTEIENNIFDGCTSLTNVTYKGKTYNSDNIGELFDTIMYPDMSGGMLIENNTLVKVSENAVTIEIPDTVTEISEDVFNGCSKLESMTFKNKTYFNDRENRNNLIAAIHGEEGLTIKNGVLTKVDPDLTEVKIPDRVTEIANVPDTPAFFGCENLKKVTFGNGVTEIKGDYFARSDVNVFGGWGYNVTEIIIPEGVTRIGYVAFANCENLTSVTISDSVTSIAAPVMSDNGSAFRNCTNLKNVTYKGKTYDYAHIADLYNAINGNNTSSSGNNTPSSSSSKPSASSSTPSSSGNNTPSSSSSKPSASSSKPSSSGNNTPSSSSSKPSASSSKPSSSGNNTSNVNDVEGLTIVDGVLISVSSDLAEVKIPDGVTEIGERAFEDNARLKSVTIPGSVTKIGDFAFAYCTSLSSITIPNGVKSIGAGAFDRCFQLQSVTIPDSVTKIGGSAFVFCTSLKSITIPKGVTEICAYTFSECTSLQSITIPNTVTEICDYAFFQCKSLKSITLPNGATKIGESAFSNCTNLQSATVPNSVTEIGRNAFAGCSSLQDIKIPNGITIIYEQVFAYCTSLQSVTILKGVTTIGKNAFNKCANLQSVSVPDSVVKVDTGAFSGCGKCKITYKGKTYDLAQLGDYGDFLQAVNGN